MIKLNRLSFYLSLLKYSIMNPKNGILMFQSKRQSRSNSKSHIRENHIKVDMNHAIQILFPHTDVSLEKLCQELSELEIHKKSFFDKLELMQYPSQEKPYPTNYSIDDKTGLFLYVLCRIVKPDKVVETGVAYGLSSMYILQAMSKNKKGRLYSIDYTFRPWESKEMIGSIIPDKIKCRWEFLFGTSSNTLQSLLKKLTNVDIFIHDSLHTYKNMLYEFTAVWPFIQNNGFLLSDDVLGNNAFYDFCIQNNLTNSFIIKQEGNSKSGLGVIRK